MDFLATVKKRLEELEEQARQMQALEQAPQPKTKKAGGPLSQSRSKNAAGGGARKIPSPQPTARSLASPDGFATPECATIDRLGSEAPGLSPQPLNRRLIEDLQGRLDEAFLLSEVLGPPRCVRGWDND